MRLFFAIIIALSSAFTFTGGAEFSFLTKTHDFPDAHEGEVLEYDFNFTNAGDKPLIITGFNVACSCTKITWPTAPIMPNEKGRIHLNFDTAGKYGYQNRKIQILSNANRSVKLSFRVFVLASNKH